MRADFGFSVLHFRDKTNARTVVPLLALGQSTRPDYCPHRRFPTSKQSPSTLLETQTDRPPRTSPLNLIFILGGAPEGA